uniref:MADF domain-containing protein n=1 Tax=Nothobranchius furzeri TaxID=105023 RepID=A0A8C6M8E4_NOTFU
MDQFEERLAEELRKYEHLYNPSLNNYKDAQVIYNSWKEIARILEMDVEQCMKKWRSMRDKFVQAFYVMLSWLEPHIKHRATSSNFKVTTLARYVLFHLHVSFLLKAKSVFFHLQFIFSFSVIWHPADKQILKKKFMPHDNFRFLVENF